MDDLNGRLHDVERTTREQAVAIERAAADARMARDAVAEVRPIVLSRSGDEQRRDKYEKNVEQAYDKIRNLDGRLVPLERWQDRAKWLAVIVGGLGAFLAWAAGLLKDLR